LFFVLCFKISSILFHISFIAFIKCKYIYIYIYFILCIFRGVSFTEYTFLLSPIRAACSGFILVFLNIFIIVLVWFLSFVNLDQIGFVFIILFSFVLISQHRHEFSQD
jgi:hypothetical protein